MNKKKLEKKNIYIYIYQIKSMTIMVIVAPTSGVSRPLSIMNFECNLM